MLSKLGYTPGMALGKTRPGAAEPLRVAVKEGRGGVGLDGERKRRLRDAAERATKRVREDEDGFRGRAAAEAAARRVAAQLAAAQGVAEQFGGDAGGEPARLAGVDVRWRGPVRERMLRDRARAERDAEKFRRDNEMQISNGRRPVYLADESEDDDDVLAYGKGTVVVPGDVDELDAPDPELEAFDALPGEERLAAVVRTLREQWHYCFWCKSTYPTAGMEGCPGPLEEDHE
jgi:hypothetical protein